MTVILYRPALSDKAIALHDFKEIHLIDETVQALSEKTGISKTVLFEARKRVRKRDGIEKEKPLYQVVLDAHKAGKVDLRVDMYKEVAVLMGVHHDVVRAAVNKGGIKRKKIHRRSSENCKYWDDIRPQLQLMYKWGVIPERVGLTRNEWRKQCALI